MKFLLNVGIDKYDPGFYGHGIDLSQCVNDSRNVYAMASGLWGSYDAIQAELLNDRRATIAEFSDRMKYYASAMKKGDILLISVSSHGTYYDYYDPVSGRTRRATGLCFHDGILWDFEFRSLLRRFNAGRRVVYISDSCFSESNWRFIREPDPYNLAKARFYKLPLERLPNDGKEIGARNVMPVPTQGDKRQIRCQFMAYASSSVYQVSYEDDRGGVFTTAILDALKFDSNLSYYQVFRRASELIAPKYPQTPVFEWVRCEKYTGDRFLTT
ncbi:MAG: caspase family protein [Saprospiraceae bacterium]|nr:caspase family protein [Saprospiraceae bacterium]